MVYHNVKEHIWLKFNMTYSISELLILIKETPVTEEEVNTLRNRLIKQSKEKDPTIPSKEFLDRYYSL